MQMLSKLLRRSCAIATSGALVFSGMPATAQQPSPPEQSSPPQQSEQPAAQPLGQAQLETLVAPIALYPDDLVAQTLLLRLTRWRWSKRNVGCKATLMSLGMHCRMPCSNCPGTRA